MRKVGLVYDEIFLWHETPQWHPECKERLISIIDKLKSSDIWNKLLRIKPFRAEFDDLSAVHTKEHIERIKNMSSGYADPDTYVSKRSFEAALYAAGAVIEAIKRCRDKEIERAFCAVRPPGHHAEANRAMGFCLFNNIAIGARYAQKMGYKKIFVIDFDVHHGNGTQHIFEEDDTVFYFSTHQYPHYPGTGDESEKGRGKGEGFTYNMPMRSGSGDKEYFSAYNEKLPHLVKKFEPDMILVSAGYDIHRKDPLAGIRVSDEGIRGIVRGILSCSLSLPVIFALEGGYDLDALAGSVLITLEELLSFH